MRLPRSVIVTLAGAATMALVVLAATDPADFALDLFYSATGFCAGFLYASTLYAGDRKSPNTRGRDRE